jgi:hypothetical protein
MRTGPIGQPAIHRANVQIDGFDAAKGTFHAGEGLVAAHRRRVVKGLRRQTGAYDIDTVDCRLCGNLGGLA